MSPLAPTSPSVLSLLFPRQDIGTDAANVANTLSSWNNCMAQSFCKWPVIAAIIVGSLIVLSIVICCARCLCCGLECCCVCCSCFNRCCPSPRGSKGGKYAQAPQQQQYQYPPQQPYGYHPGMSYGPPQFATFDASTGKVTEDSLPAMPSWQTAESRHVEDTSYHSAGAADDSLNKEMSGAADGIPMGAMAVTSPTREEPVQYYEDPDEAHKPMLDSQQLEARPYQRHLDPQQHYVDENAPYPERSSFAATDFSHTLSQSTPSHPYGQYNQQQDAYGAYGHENAGSPTSTYTSNPPTYHTRAPTGQSSYRGMPSDNPYAAPAPRSPLPVQQDQYQGYRGGAGLHAYGGNSNNDYPRSQGTNYGPISPVETPVEMPGSLVPGGGQRFNTQQQSPNGVAGNPGSLYRKPVTGNWQ